MTDWAKALVWFTLAAGCAAIWALVIAIALDYV